jgi:predicted nucleic acid-binding protein
VDITSQIAEEAAQLRAAHNIKTPDAIQVATAISLGAAVFLTNDAKLASIPGIKVLVLKDLKKDS